MTEAISIHAPREGSDDLPSLLQFLQLLISIHAPREGSDDRYSLLPVRGFQFQSTLPVRGAT